MIMVLTCKGEVTARVSFDDESLDVLRRYDGSGRSFAEFLEDMFPDVSVSWDDVRFEPALPARGR